MPRPTAKENVASTAHLTAWMRTLARATAGHAANGDYLADQFLLPFQRRTLHLPRLSRWLIERMMPGALGYFTARTRYFDEILLREAAAGLDQLVLLGAGFDSRPIRFANELAAARVFEVDMPQVLSIRASRLRDAAPANTIPVPIDFEHDDLTRALAASGYVTAGTRTFFLWEGVTYYLPPEAVDAVLAQVATLGGAGSSLLFDYVTHDFFSGDNSGYGSKQLAEGWRKLGDVNRSGVRDVEALLRPHGLRVSSEIDALELERRYLQALPGSPLKAWGPMRIAHAVRGERSAEQIDR